MARIELSHERHVQEYDVGDKVVIGRSNSCGVKVPSTKASRRHCQVYKAIGGYFLEDLGSANGTLLNGVRAGRKLLKHNDIISIGNVSLRFIDKREDPLLGRRFGKYQVVEKLGAGAEGVIYRARQVALNKEVALKIFHSQYISSRGGAENLRHYADIRILLQQENIVRTYEFAEVKDKYYYILGYLAGENLQDSLVRQGKLKQEDVISYGVNIASALDYIHSFGVIQGDLKPASMTITPENKVVIHDTGLLVKLGDSIELEGHEEISGYLNKEESDLQPLAYIAPEIFRGDRAVVGSDIYSLAVLLYHLLMGDLPFAGNSSEELLAAKLQVDRDGISESGVIISQELEDLLFAGMSFDPAERPESAAVFKEQLQRLLGESSRRNKRKRAVSQENTVEKADSVRLEVEKKESSFPFAKVSLLFIILGVLAYVGYWQYEKYQLRKRVELERSFKLAQELYNQRDYERARNIFAEILENNPTAEMSKVVQQRLRQLMLSRAQLELLNLQEKLAVGELTKEDVVEILQRKLRSDTLSKPELSEYKGYLISLGGDADMRYIWQKKVDNDLEQGLVLQAYKDLQVVRPDRGEDLQLVELRKYKQRVKAELNKVITVEYSQAGAFIKEGKGSKAFVVLEGIANKYPPELGWQGRIISYFAEVNLKQGDYIINKYKAALQAVSKTEQIELQEIAFQLGEALSKQPGGFSLLSIDRIDGFFTTYLAELQRRLEVDPVSGVGREVVELEIAGKRDLVELIYKDGKYLALSENSSREVGLAEVTVESLEKLSPLFELDNKALVGAGLYFISRGSVELGKGYLNTALESEYKQQVQDYLALTEQVLKLSESRNAAGRLRLASSVNIGGSRFIWDYSVGKELRFAASSGEEFALAVKNDSITAVLGGRKLFDAVPVGSAGNMLELIGYWDRVLLMNSGVVLAEIKQDKIGELAIAPYSPAAGLEVEIKFKSK